MLMFNHLPYYVTIQNKKYKINVDYRNMILFEQEMQNRQISDEDKVKNAIENFYFLDDESYSYLKRTTIYKDAVDKLIWFYKCGREDYHRSTKGTKPANQIYNYDYDDEYIFGAFYQTYKIDLSTAKLHWWKFKALLDSLPDNTEFVKIKQYRSYSGSDKNMQEMKRYWKLPVASNEQERLDLIYEKFKNQIKK